MCRWFWCLLRWGVMDVGAQEMDSSYHIQTNVSVKKGTI